MFYRNLYLHLPVYLFCISGSELGKLSSEQKGQPSTVLQLELHDNTLIVPRCDEKQVMSFTIK